MYNKKRYKHCNQCKNQIKINKIKYATIDESKQILAICSKECALVQKTNKLKVVNLKQKKRDKNE